MYKLSSLKSVLISTYQNISNQDYLFNILARIYKKISIFDELKSFKIELFLNHHIGYRVA